ncbi:putative nucleotidyltransferase with HDIG domain [Castellaniella defragrans]|uniref:Putative nucleotidyltransferase with HDIG domain n=1 Tax=Castellaniella defragrans TaxID=75697 RepID=A0A7W9TMI2_CASDE|nr:putative nucleotidyltransferase with HDIG domain [Castellaniella defragrans]
MTGTDCAAIARDLRVRDMPIKRVSLSELRLGMYIHRLKGDWFRHPFWRGSFLLSRQQDLEAIQAAGIQSVWIDTDKGRSPPDPAVAQANARRDAQARQGDGFAPVEPSPTAVSLEEEIDQARRLCLAAQDQVMGMFEEARMGRAIDPEATLPLVRQIADSVGRHPQALFSVARLKTRDNYTYLHSVAVCALMLALSRQLRLDGILTRHAGLGGLMHDVGKAAIPLSILNKPGQLTDDEFDIMKTHAFLGAAMLREGGADEAIQSIALHHHEKFDGTGYPDRLAGKDIPLLARMGAVCDVYDAVTSERRLQGALESRRDHAPHGELDGAFRSSRLRGLRQDGGHLSDRLAGAAEIPAPGGRGGVGHPFAAAAEGQGLFLPADPQAVRRGIPRPEPAGMRGPHPAGGGSGRLESHRAGGVLDAGRVPLVAAGGAARGRIPGPRVRGRQAQETAARAYAARAYAARAMDVSRVSAAPSWAGAAEAAGIVCDSSMWLRCRRLAASTRTPSITAAVPTQYGTWSPKVSPR